MPKGNDELLNFINTTIAEVQADCKINELQTKWLDGAQDVPANIRANIP